MGRRNFTADEKLAILEAAEKSGVTETLREFGIYSNTYYDWKDKYDSGGIDALKSHGKSIDAETKRLLKENRQLKKLLAEKELALSIKDELLKKSLSRKKKK